MKNHHDDIKKVVNNFKVTANKKTAKISGSFGSTNLVRGSGLSSEYNYNTSENIVKFKTGRAPTAARRTV